MVLDLSVLPYRYLLEQAVLLEGATEESSLEVFFFFPHGGFYKVSIRAFDLAF